MDFLFGDGSRMAFWLQSAPAENCCTFVGGPYLEPRFFGQPTCHHAPEIYSGFGERESAELLKGFFRDRRG